jgi:hypothetical protein
MPTVGHHCRPSSVPRHPGEHRPPPPCLAPSPYATLAPTAKNDTPGPPAKPHRPRYRATAPHWSTRGHGDHAGSARTAPCLAGWSGPCWPWAKYGPLLCAEEILFQINFNSRNSNKLQNCIENTILHGKIQNKFI